MDALTVDPRVQLAGDCSITGHRLRLQWPGGRNLNPFLITVRS